MQKIKYLCIGATAFSVALAKNHVSETLILERRIYPLSEFVKSLKNVPLGTPKTEDGKNVQSEIYKKTEIQRNIFAFSGELAGMILEKKISVTYGAYVIKIQKTDGGFEVDYYTVSGMETIFAEKIIDTEPIGNFGDFEDYEKKSLCALLKNDNGVEGKTYGKLADKTVWKFEVPKEDDYKTAKDKLLCSWESANRDGNILFAVANDFCYDYQKPVKIEKDGYYFIPSASFESVFSAYEEGLLWNICI